MEPNTVIPNMSGVAPAVCSVCHQPVSPQFYFCPNCGTKLNTAPLSVTPETQFGLYAFSIILPWICFIMITRWQGITYVRSSDPKTRQIGIIACVLLAASTFLTFWIAYVTLVNMVQSQIASVNSDMSI